MVGARGFDPPTPCPPCRCATKLRYAPTEPQIIAESRLLPLEHFENALQFLANGGRRDRLRHGHGPLCVAAAWQRPRAVLLEAVARTVDGEAVLVEELADAPDEQHLVVLVIAPVAAALEGLQLRELLLPVTQHMGLHPAQLANFADREIALGGAGREPSRRQLLGGP